MLRILISYYYEQRRDLNKQLSRLACPVEVFFDSGAYSAHAQGHRINLDAYIAFIHKFKHLIQTYANLDVIGNPILTYQNQLEMEKQELAPLPVYHYGERRDWLERYCQTYDYVGLGGMVGKALQPKNLLPIFRITKETNTRLHGFGCCSWDLIQSLPWYSVDSTDWIQHERFQKVCHFSEKQRSLISFDLTQPKNLFTVLPRLNQLSMSLKEYRNNHYLRRAYNGLSIIKAQNSLQRIKIFLADNSWTNFRNISQWLITQSESCKTSSL